MSITAKKIAQMLNLSETAVSMALNNKPGVSDETRELVISTAEKYGYDFSRIAMKKDSYNIAVIFHVATNAIFSQKEICDDLVEGIVQKCNEDHNKVKIRYFHEKLEPFNDLLADLSDAEVDGIIIIATEMSAQNCRQILSLNKPTVILDSFFTGLNCDAVLINNREGAYIGTSYLISKYLKQPGHLISSYNTNNFVERRVGFQTCISDYGYNINSSYDYYLPPNINGAYETFTAIIKSGKPLARSYFADNDLIAIGAIKALKEQGYKVPGDVAIIGFDNTYSGELIDPPLSSISVSRNVMARTAVDQLIKIIKKPSKYSFKVAISTSLVIRKSA